MKFSITATSTRGSNAQPCEEAYQGTYVEKDIRTVDNPVKIVAFHGDQKKADEWWYSTGTNHRVENGYIVRDMGEGSAWFVDIESLEQLMKFIETNGQVIVRDYGIGHDPSIEIYDGYRE